MKVDVREILDRSRQVVAFRCDFGSARGRWMGADPARLGTATVEIDIPGEVSEWTALEPGVTSLAEEPGSGVRVHCEVLRGGDEEDPVVAVRLGSDVLLVEIPGRRAELTAGTRISFLATEIQLHPYEV